MKKLSTSNSFNSPLPTNLKGECKKATKILDSFLDPGQGFDLIIPPSILENAMGLAIFTVLKAGFLFSGRAGSGLVVARLSDGSWSAPSALFTGGIGAGGQIGAELTDFILVLNTKEAVKTFSHFGNITLGGNISIAAGPIGRNAEASGSATLKHISAIYSYSKTRGLFAGVSLEGSVIFTRNDANEKFYGDKYTAKQLLNGTVPPPLEADSLYRALNAKFRSLGNTGAMYQRIIQREATKLYRNTTISAPGTLPIPPIRRNLGYSTPNLIGPPPTANYGYHTNVPHSVTNDSCSSLVPMTTSNSYPTNNSRSIQYNKPFQPDSPIPQHVYKPNQFSPILSNRTITDSTPKPLYGSQKTSDSSSDSDKSVSPPLFEGQRMSFTTEIKKSVSQPNQQRMSFTTEIKKTAVPPPLFENQQLSFSQEITSSPPKPPNHHSEPQKAKALYAFIGEQDLDLSFQPGDVILVTDNQDAWWTGILRGKSGSFPSNYVELL